MNTKKFLNSFVRMQKVAVAIVCSVCALFFMALDCRVVNAQTSQELSVKKDMWDYPVLTQIQHEASKDYDTPYKLPFLELLLSDDLFIKQLDDQKSMELGKIVLEKYERKLENSHVYSLYNIKKTFLLGAVALNKQNISERSPGQQDTVKRFIENYNNLDPNLLTEISKIISGL